MPGAANPWYSENVTYLALNDEVIGVITRGGVPEDDGLVEGPDVNRELWSDIEIGMAIPVGMFELPYPVGDADWRILVPLPGRDERHTPAETQKSGPWGPLFRAN